MLMILVQWMLHKILYHLLQCHLGVRTCLCTFWYWGFNSEFLRWQRSINDAKCTVLPSFLASLIISFLFSDFRQLPCQYFLEFCPFLLQCYLCIWYFHCLRHKNKFVPRMVVTQWINPLSCNMIFMISVRRSFHAFPHRFIGLNNTSIFCLAILFNATGFPVLITLKFARHCGWHRNFQLSTRIFHDILKSLIIRINEVNTTQYSGIVQLWFLDSPLLLFFAFQRIAHIFPNLWPQSVWPGGRLFSCQSAPGPIVSIRWFSFNTVNLVRSRIKKDVLRTWSSPESFTVPSSIGKKTFHHS